MPWHTVALNRVVQVGASEMHQAFHSDVDLHNSICNPAPHVNRYRFKGLLMHHKHRRGRMSKHILKILFVHLENAGR